MVWPSNHSIPVVIECVVHQLISVSESITAKLATKHFLKRLSLPTCSLILSMSVVY